MPGVHPGGRFPDSPSTTLGFSAAPPALAVGFGGSSAKASCPARAHPTHNAIASCFKNNLPAAQGAGNGIFHETSVQVQYRIGTLCVLSCLRLLAVAVDADV